MEKPRYTLLFKLPDDFELLSRQEQGRVIIHNLQVEGKAKLPTLAMVSCHYEGSGDSWGDAHWVFYGQSKNDNSVTEAIDVEFDFAHATADRLDQWVCDWVDETDPGWENNDGGFGTVEFMLDDPPQITLDHNARFTDSRNVANHDLFTEVKYPLTESQTLRQVMNEAMKLATKTKGEDDDVT